MMDTAEVDDGAPGLEALQREHDDRLAVMALEDEADDRREQQIRKELEAIRAGLLLRDAAGLISERRDLQQRRKDRLVSRELTEAARREVEVAILRAKLEGEVPDVEAGLRERAEDVREALDGLGSPDPSPVRRQRGIQGPPTTSQHLPG